MASKYSVVDKVAGVEQPSGNDSAEAAAQGGSLKGLNFATVHLQGGDSHNVDLTDKRASTWLRLLGELHQEGAHVFLEVDANTNTIQSLLLPKSFTVEDIATSLADDRIDVELGISHARHFVRGSNPNYQGILDALKEARKHGTRVLITETPNEHEIIDVRPDPDPSRRGVNPDEVDAADSVKSHTFSIISDTDALELFKYLAGQAHIPFNYPDDGCWARAHEMRRLMIERGQQPEKVWIYGNLKVSTRNHPECEVRWLWHVAPTLRVSSGDGSTRLHAIDPSLFQKPVLVSEWAGVQGDSGALLKESDSRVFYRKKNGQIWYDDDYVETKDLLRDYSRERDLRFAEYGKPPYNCP